MQTSAKRKGVAGAKTHGGGRLRVRAASGRGILAVFTGAVIATGVVASSACVMSRESSNPVPLRAATEVPDHFLVGELSGNETSEPGGDLVCRSPLIDPRNGTRITLVRSKSGRGDYEVPAGKYGVGEKEVLRIECANGKAIGIFKR